ncbi:GNAT family N-acetyltransferase [Snuella sp. CAU 1569]|uniref:GNAT family N-acetyltransferase n=2 Tax=Snuella sedimenti TaxID=2798802 RepID=A0A8J7LZ51_9FLAO|nr:GNAT family N-acetyltransferase [Snuella sedimenti]
MSVYKVRQPVLRGGKPIESCVFEGDDLETTIHVGVFVAGELVAVSSFLKNKHDKVLSECQYQLRGMAVLESFQNKGLGSIMLNYGEQLLKNKLTGVIWCNAREVALNFYKKQGYTIVGEPFNIKNIGLHYTMKKKLT